MAQVVDLEARRTDPEALYEVVDGERVEIPTMGVYAGWIARRLYDALAAFLDDRHLGSVIMEVLFILDVQRNLRRRPDIAFVSFDRWAADREISEEGDWNVVPDLAIEVISPKDRDREVHKKLRESFEAGVGRVWLVRPAERQIYV